MSVPETLDKVAGVEDTRLLCVFAAREVPL